MPNGPAEHYADRLLRLPTYWSIRGLERRTLQRVDAWVAVNERRGDRPVRTAGRAGRLRAGARSAGGTHVAGVASRQPLADAAGLGQCLGRGHAAQVEAERPRALPDGLGGEHYAGPAPTNCRSTYGRIPPALNAPSSSGVSIRAVAVNDTARPSLASRRRREPPPSAPAPMRSRSTRRSRRPSARGSLPTRPARTAGAARPCSPGCCGGSARSSRRSRRGRRAAACPWPPSHATSPTRTPCRR